MDAIYEGRSFPCGVFSRVGCHKKTFKQNPASTSFYPFVYSIVRGFEGDDFDLGNQTDMLELDYRPSSFV